MGKALQEIGRSEVLVLRLWRRVLYKAPFGGPLPWINLGVGCFSFLSGLLLTVSGGPMFLFVGPMLTALGLMFVCWGVSDLLPSRHRTVIVTLRAGLLVFQSTTIILAIAGILQQALGS